MDDLPEGILLPRQGAARRRRAGRGVGVGAERVGDRSAESTVAAMGYFVMADVYIGRADGRSREAFARGRALEAR